MSLLRRIEKSLDGKLRGLFVGSRDQLGAREAIELYRDALDQIGAKAIAGKRGDRIFPFSRIFIELRAATPERKAVLEALFEAGQLVEDIRATLAEERTTIPGNLSVAVRYPPDAAEEMRIACENTEQPQPLPAEPTSPGQIVPARLTTLTGMSNIELFRSDKPRANIGRDREVVDSLGRTVRRNDLYFPEGKHEANASVSRSHAHLRFEAGNGQWRVYDDGSTLGTSIFRAGQRIEVPAHAARGLILRTGDEIYLGQVRLRFDC